MLRRTKKLVSIALAQATGLILPSAVLAVDNDIVPNTIKPINDIVAIIRAVIQFILVVDFVLAFVMLLIGGIRWITAGGDEKGVAGARNMVSAALSGLVIVVVAFAIILLVETFFNVKIISGGVSIPNITQ